MIRLQYLRWVFVTLALTGFSVMSFAQISVVGSETKVNTTITNSQQNAAIAMDSNGAYVVVWESFGTDGDGYGIYGQRYNNDGSTNGAEFKVNSSTVGNQRYPDVAMDETGRFAVVWMDDTKDGSGWGVYCRRYNNDGTTFGSEFKVNGGSTDHQRNPKIAMDKDGNFFITWMDVALDGSGFSIQGKRYAFSGALAADFQVNTSAASFHGHPDVAKGFNGDVVLVWQSEGLDGSGHGIYAQRYNSAGATQGSEFRANTTTAGNQQEPSVAMDSSGNFIIAWTSFAQDGDKGGIYAQRYNSNGTTNGSEFKISTTTTGSQDNVTAILNINGGGAVVWNSYGQDGSFEGIYIQAYDNKGSTIGSETRINTRTTDFQQFGDLAYYDPSDTLVVAWQDGLRSSTATHDGDDYGIYMQRYFITSLVSASAGADATICAGDSVQIGGSPTASDGVMPYSYSWNPMTGLDDASLANPMASPASTTEYIVTVTDNNSNTAMDTMTVTVNPNPIAAARSDTSICVGDSVQLGGNPTASGGAGSYTYSWIPTTGLDDASLAGPEAKPVTTTEYIITVTDANNCIGRDTVNVTILPNPIAAARADTSICIGDSVQLGGNPTANGGTGPYTYSWTPTTDLDDASLADPEAKPTTTTQYIVTVTDANNCTDSDTVIVTIFPVLIVSAGADTAICAEDSTSLGGSPTASGGATPFIFSWLPTTGLDNAAIANPMASPAVNTEYIVTVTDANNCVVSDTINLTVNPNPIAAARADTSICVGDSVQLGGNPTASGGAGSYTYSWTPTTGLDDASIADPEAKPTATTQYIVTVTDANNCTDSDTVIVTIFPALIVSAGADVAICAEDSASLGGSPTATGGATPFTFSWLPTTGLDDATNTNPMASPAANTEYIITVTDANNCVVSDTINVTVNPNPIAAARADTSICVGDSVQLGGNPTASGGAGSYTYSWIPTAGLDDATIADPEAKPTTTTEYIVTVTDANNCIDRDTVNVTILPNPIADAGSDTSLCPGQSAQIGGSPAVSGGTPAYTFSWLPTTGLDNAGIANPTATPLVTTEYILTVTDANNCIGRDSITVTIYPNPVADAGNDISICAGASTQLGGTSTASGGTSPYTYSWLPTTDLDNAAIANPTATPTATMDYIVTVTDANNCVDKDTITVTVNPNPVADAGSNQVIAPGGSVSIGGSPTASGGTSPYTYSWTPSTGLDDATAANPNASPASTTIYTVEVTDANSCKDTSDVLVTVTAGLAANAGANQEICPEDSVQIGGSPTAMAGAAPYTYSWTPTAGLDDATAANPKASPASTEIYTVEVTDNNSQTAQDQVTVTVNPNPVADAGNDISICAGASTQLGGTSTASGGTSPYTYSWLPTTGLDNAAIANPTATPTATTDYIVTVTDANNCIDKDTITVTVNPNPVADAGSNQSIAPGGSVQIGGTPTADGGKPGYTFSWSPTTGLDDETASNPNASPASTTTYTVIVTDANSCKDTSDVLVTVTAGLAANAGANQEICPEDSVEIGGSPTASAGASPYTYSWTPTTGLDDATAANPKASPASTENYTVEVTDNNSQTAQDQVTVTVNPNPIADAGIDTSICAGASAEIGGDPTASGGTSGYTYSWLPIASLDDATIANPTATPTATTDYIVTVTDSKNCIDKDTITVTVNPNPVADVGSNQVIAPGGSVQIGGSPTADGGTPGYTFSWSPTTGLDDETASNPNASPASTTMYTVILTDANSCKDTSDVLVTVTAGLAANAGANQEICFEDSVQIGGSPTAMAGAIPYTYSWTPTTGLDDATAANPKASPASTTIYTVEVTDNNSQTAQDQVTVTVNPNPVTDAGNDVSICAGESTSIGGSPTANGGTSSYTYSWLPIVGLDDAALANPTATPTATTDYIVTVTDSKNCIDKDTITVTINPNPVADAGSNKVVAPGGSVAIGGNPTASGGTPGYTYSWSPMTDLDDETIANPTASPASSTTYTVIVTDANSCKDTSDVLVTVTAGLAANAGADQTICDGASAAIGSSPTAMDGAPPYTYSWSPTTGLDDATAANPDASPTSNTTYIVTVTDNNSQTAQDQVDVNVNPTPVTDAGADVIIAPGDMIMIGGSPTASGGTPGYSYSWSPTTGLDNAAAANPNAGPANTTTYIVTVTDNNGCTADDQVVVTVEQPKDFIFLAQDEIIIERSKESGSFGDIHSNGNIIIEKGDPSTYTTNLTAAGDIEINKEITIDGDVTAGGSIDNDGTITGTVNANASVAVVNLPAKSFSAGGANHSVGKEQTLTLAPGSYGNVTLGKLSTLKLTSGDYYFTNLLANNRTIVFEFDLSSGNPVNINVTNELQFGREFEIHTTNGENDSRLITFCTLQNKTITIGKEALFIGTLIAPNAKVTVVKNTCIRGCVCAKVIEIERDCLWLYHDATGGGTPTPVADAGADETILPGGAVQIGGSPTASGGTSPYSYSWTPTTGLDDATIANPTASPTTTTTYTVVVTDANSQTAQDEVIVTVDANIVADAGADQVISPGDMVQIGGSPTASGGTSPYSYSWTPTTGLDNAAAANPNAGPTNTTVYTVVVTDNDGFTGQDEVNVTVNQPQAAKNFVFLAEDNIAIEGSEEGGAFGDMHSNADLRIGKGDPNQYITNLSAVGEIIIEKKNTIDGDVTAGGSVDNDGTVTGTINANASVAAIGLPNKSFSAGGSNHNVGSNQTLTLAPGSYGNVSLGKSSTLKLSSGEYFFNTLNLAEKRIIVDFDLSSGNPVTVNVTTELLFGRELEVHSTNGETDSDLITFCTLQNQRIEIGKEAFFYGSLIAVNAKVTLVKNSQLRGAICAKEIDIDSDCIWLHHDAPGSLPGVGALSKFIASDTDDTNESSTPSSYALEQNYPNPFNPTTRIAFALPQAVKVTLEIYNILGYKVRTFAIGSLEAGFHNVQWDGRNESGRQVVSGVYIYKLQAGEHQEVKRMLLMK